MPTLTLIQAGQTVSITASMRTQLRGHFPERDITANYHVLDTRDDKEAQIFFAKEQTWFPIDQLSLVA